MMWEEWGWWNIIQQITQFLLLVLCHFIVIDDNVDDNDDSDVPPLPPMTAAIDRKYDILKENGKIIVIMFVIIDESPVLSAVAAMVVSVLFDVFVAIDVAVTIAIIVVVAIVVELINSSNNKKNRMMVMLRRKRENLQHYL